MSGLVYSTSLSTKDNIVTFNDNTGKNIKDSGYKINDFATSDHIHPEYVKTADYTDTDILNKIKNVDGYGSGLDTDLWQGYTPQTIEVETAYNARILDNNHAYTYRNVLNIKGIFNTPPSNPYTGLIIMIGNSPSGDFETMKPGTVLKYDEDSEDPNWKWITIGNMYWG